MRFKSSMAFMGLSVSLLCLALGLSGCGGIDPVPISTPSNDSGIYARLVMNHHGVTLSTTAPYDTVQLTATPQDLTGKPISDLPAPVFFVPTEDTAYLSVTSDGLVHARKAGSNHKVVARVVLPGNVGHVDTTIIDVNDIASPPRLASLSLDFYNLTTLEVDSSVLGLPIISDPGSDIAQPYFGFMHLPDGGDGRLDSDLAFDGSPPFLRRWSTSFFVLLNYGNLVLATDSTGNLIDNLRMDDLQSSAPSVLSMGDAASSFSSGLYLFEAVAPGKAEVIGRITAYGITVTDTVAWRITPPPLAWIHFVPRSDGTVDFVPRKVTVRTYGVVEFLNWMSDTAQVIFDDPTNIGMPSADICTWLADRPARYASGEPHCGAGDAVMPARLGPFSTAASTAGRQAIWHSRLRQFPVPGTYRFHDPRTGKTGEIVVSDE